ncbi:MAG: MBL fold metallo-hydrolase [Eubacteriales bacterium]|nr:MBL fold metallo-hydrolase [Bacillota bacterium]MBV1727120.1 MBL fold metallo-hydrolase [Desulforudis sp.]MDP3051251.1 MBL fold metallo-hydrolase [Eubacteriales bacterium]MDQ7789733.1 MBL fold metallo-hydrolase [Clostridia bacterium]MBU4532309.1 MBL fold metallo-hydrolase [Bacillota bacterium]
MELTVLGCWAPYPRAGGACSGYLVRSGSTAVLVDAGHGTFSRLSGIMNFRDLTAMCISHYHPDHSVDLSAVRHAIGGAIRDGSREGLLPIYVPEEPTEDYGRVAAWRESFTIHPVDQLSFDPKGRRTANIGGIDISLLATRHNLPCYALSLSSGGRRIVYTADSALFPELVEFSRGADLLLAEASGYHSDWEYLHRNHLTGSLAGELARDAGVGRLVLTHFWPEYDVGRICAEASSVYGGQVEAAEELKTFQI